MTAAEVLTGGGIILAAMTLIQIAPIKLDPWSAVARAIGRAINKDGQRTHTGPGSCNLTMNCCGTFHTRGRNLLKFLRRSTNTKNIARKTRTTRTTGPPMPWPISAGYMMTG